jgi:uncharacterized membrane protein YsdA (DUF1294 family)
MKYYLIIINIFLFILYGIDKLLAIKHKERISGFALSLISLCGGSIGGILGMITFHHKTKKIKFWILNILFTTLWIIYFFVYIKNY